MTTQSVGTSGTVVLSLKQLVKTVVPNARHAIAGKRELVDLIMATCVCVKMPFQNKFLLRHYISICKNRKTFANSETKI